MSLERQAAIGLKWSAVGKLLSQVITWGVTLAVLRILAPEDYGLVALSAVVVATIAALAEIGLGASLVQARDVSRDELARTTGTLIIVNGIAAALLVLLAPLLAGVFGAPALTDVLRVCALQFVFIAIDAVPQSMAYREMRFKWLTTLDLVGAVIASLATLALALLGMGVWALVLGNLAGSALRSLLLVSQGTAVWPQFTARGIGHHLRFGGAVTLSRLLWKFANQFDVVIAGRMLTPDAVGLYAVVMQLATLPMQKAMSVVNQVAFPAMSRLQDELPRLREHLLDAFRLLFFAAIPALWGLSCVAPEVIHLLLDERWSAATFPLQVASLVAPLRMLAAVLSTAISAVGRADLDLRNSIATFVVFLIAFACGVHGGVDGLAASWIAAVPIVFALNWNRARVALGLELLQILAAGRAPLIAGTAMYAAVTGLRPMLEDSSLLLRLPLLIGAGAAVYLALVTLLDRGVWHDLRRFVGALR